MCLIFFIYNFSKSNVCMWFYICVFSHFSINAMKATFWTGERKLFDQKIISNNINKKRNDTKTTFNHTLFSDSTICTFCAVCFGTKDINCEIAIYLNTRLTFFSFAPMFGWWKKLGILCRNESRNNNNNSRVKNVLKWQW